MTDEQEKWIDGGKVECMSLHRVMEELIERTDYARLMTITALDAGEKFRVVYHIDVTGKVIQIRVEVPRDDPSIPTITDLFPSSLIYEREVMEFFGIKFKNHPQPQHLLLPDDWPEGLYPLRKEQSIQQIVKEVEKRV